MPAKIKLMHVKKISKISRENTNFSAKSIKFVPVKEKIVGVKKLENGPKSGREIGFLSVKKLKKRPKMALTGTFYFHGKKKTLTITHTFAHSHIHKITHSHTHTLTHTHSLSLTHSHSLTHSLILTHVHWTY